MRKSVAAVVLTVSLLGSCASGVAPLDCRDPPEDAMKAESDIELSVLPDPLIASDGATLTVEYERSGIATVGVAVDWECWDGEQWLRTHVLLRATSNTGPAVEDVSPGSTITVPAVGLHVPASHQILVPDVPPGTYRVSDLVLDGQHQYRGHLIVEVVAPTR